MSVIDRLLPAPIGGGFSMKDYWVWCGSVIKGEDGLYHMFASRWSKKYPFFNGYIAYSEIVRAVSETPEGPYQFMEVVFKKRGSGFWDGRMTHNPSILKYKDKYLLFYIGSTYNGQDPDREDLMADNPPVCTESYSNIRIGLAISESVKGPWTTFNDPILAPRPGKWDCTVVTNPAPCIRPDGSIFLVYRSNTLTGMKLGLAMAESPSGCFHRLNDGPILFEFDKWDCVEDPFIWWENDHFELIAKDCSGEICGEIDAGIHAWSEDGLNWEPCNPLKAYSRQIQWSDGSVTLQGCVERPQLLFENGNATHFFAATADGEGGFNATCRTWTMVIPLK